MTYLTKSAVVALMTFVPAASFAQDWTGAYAGLSIASVTADVTTVIEGATLDGFASDGDYDMSLSGTTYGIQAGYNFELGGGFIMGVEASYHNGEVSGSIIDPYYDDEGEITSSIDQTTSLKARIGYAMGSAMVFGTLGTSTSQGTVTFDDDFIEEESMTLTGVSYGLGVEYMVSANMSVVAEVSTTDYGTQTWLEDQHGGEYAIDADVTSQTVSVGMNFHF